MATGITSSVIASHQSGDPDWSAGQKPLWRQWVITASRGSIIRMAVRGVALTPSTSPISPHFTRIDHRPSGAVSLLSSDGIVLAEVATMKRLSARHVEISIGLETF